jgi:hypothetical protein
MKPTTYLKLIPWCLCAIFFQLLSGCMSTAKLQMIEPAAITFPKDIDTIAVINRFLSSNYNTSNSSYNYPFGDEHSFNKEASDSCVSSLFHVLGKSPRFKDIDITEELYRTGNDFFAPPLPATSAIELCRAYKTQAIIVLDGFHTNASTNTQMHSRQVSYQTPYVLNGVTYYRTNYRTEYYYTATLQVFYSIGYRFYHGSDGTILDEYRYDNQFSYSRTASTSSSALYMLPNKKKVIAQIASVSGDLYAHRIAPMWRIVKRCYYTTPGKELAHGHQCVIQKNWTDARNTWEDLYKNAPTNRMKGIAAYNIALSYEMDDNLDSAVEWANKAKNLFVKGSIYDNTTSKYLATLDYRMAVRQKVTDQMER